MENSVVLAISLFLFCFVCEEINGQMRFYNVVEGKDLLISCNFKQSCRWADEDGPIFGDGNLYQISKTGCELEIKNISFKERPRKLKCQVSNTEVEDIMINVLVIPEVFFEYSRANRSLSSEIALNSDVEEFSFNCVAEKGYPKADIDCQENGSDMYFKSFIQENPNRRGLYDVISELKVKFENPNEFEKNISCKIHHKSENNPKIISVALRKKYPTSMVYLEVSKQNGKYQLKCVADGYPSPDFMIVKKDPDQVINHNKMNPILVQEFGTYYCLAKNELNEQQINSNEITISEGFTIPEKRSSTVANIENITGAALLINKEPSIFQNNFNLATIMAANLFIHCLAIYLTGFHCI